MEERESPAGNGKDEPPLNSSTYIPFPLPLPPGNSQGSETYVVHFPRDQVYRIPPPENAQIFERHRPQKNQKKCGSLSCYRQILVPLIIVIVAVVILVATIFSLYNPKSPDFAVTNFHAKNLPSSISNYTHGVHRKPEYSISLQLENPNKRMDVHYGDGTMLLGFKGKEIASGKYSSVIQDVAKETEVVEILHGTKKALPTSIEKSLNDKQSKSMILTIEVPIKVTSWVRNSEKNAIVTCDFTVNKVAEKGTKILFQECRADS